MKVALVYDRLNKFGGAERVLITLHKLWPDAPLYTAVYDPGRTPWTKDFKVIASPLQVWPLPKNRHEWYPFLMPYAFESFCFDEYDLVVSLTSAEAKGIITKPQTLHICYQLTPTRYLWSDHLGYRISNFVFPLQEQMRRWDFIASHRPDRYLAISQTVADRLAKFYRVSAPVMFPPVDTDFFRPGGGKSDDYFLAVSRLVQHKRLDLVIEAFNKLGWKLKIVGSGVQDKFLRSRAGPTIEFVGGNLTDRELLRYYQGCRALVFAGEEDFGLVALEALACGRPVIAYGQGGIGEIVIHNKTGILFNLQNSKTLWQALEKFASRQFSPEICRARALEFNEKTFLYRFKKIVEKWVEEYTAANDRK